MTDTQPARPRSDTVTVETADGSRYSYYAPPAWHERIQALRDLVPRNAVVSGALRSMSQNVYDGYIETAENRLQWAEDALASTAPHSLETARQVG